MKTCTTFTTNETTIGCDLGDKRSSLFVMHGDGTTERPKPIATTYEGMKQYFGAKEDAHVVIENGTHSRWVSRLLTELGHQVTVANPYRVKLISQSNSKSDKKDAEILARLGRTDRELLSPITHRSHEAQVDLGTVKVRDTLVRCRSKLVNQVRGMVKSFGDRLPSCDAEGFHRQTREQVPEALRETLQPLYTMLQALEEQIKALEKKVEEKAKKYPEIKQITEVQGVGVLTALTFVLTLADAHRFPKSRLVGAYLGLRPKQRQSGDRDQQLGITKTGDEMMRRLLVNGAHRILGPLGTDCDLRRWGLNLASRGGKNAKKRAVVAVARKMAVLMHRLWVTREAYEPLRNERLAQEEQARQSKRAKKAKASVLPAAA